MEENKVIAKTHKILLNNRKNGSFTGILDVLSFDINEILLETEQGMLHVKGKDLHVNRLNLEKGEVDIEGMTGTNGDKENGRIYEQIVSIGKHWIYEVLRKKVERNGNCV